MGGTAIQREASDPIMCGIAGLVNLDGRPVVGNDLGTMILPIGHRGPDGTGIFAAGQVGLAHTRLSIIDLAGGSQPMSSADGSLTITFNGEIFNFVELREELERRGRRFKTRSDTEVILHLFEIEGPDCVHRLNGQWAFGIWDARARRLFLSRDRLGVRPLFYVAAPGTFAFASEVKAIFAAGVGRRAIDPVALDQIFTFWAPVPPRTIFEGVRELPPGHSLVLEDGRVDVRPYWRLAFPSVEESRGASEVAASAQASSLLDLLVDATRIRLRSDVPVGAYLSGGLDSTVVASLVRRFTDTPLKTFSVTFDDAEFDESEYQAIASAHLGTEHQAVHCTHRDIARVFPDVVWHTERPVLRTAPAPLYLLSGLVRQTGFKVVLTGEGADEVLGGYDIFKEAKIRRFWARRLDSRWRPLLLQRLYPYMRNIQEQPPAYLKAFFHVTPELVSSPFFSHLPRWEMTASAKLFFSKALRAELHGRDSFEDVAASLPPDFARWHWFAQAQYLETAHLLPGYILSSQGDRVAMAHAVEGRFPFLDYRVVEFGAKLSPRLKMRVLNEKYLLKLMGKDLVPAAIRGRSKQPYRAPDGRSFFAEHGAAAPPDYVADLLSASRLAADGLFEPGPVQKLVEKMRSGRAIGARDNMALVGILSTQLVVDQFIRTFSKRSACEAA